MSISSTRSDEAKLIEGLQLHCNCRCGSAVTAEQAVHEIGDGWEMRGLRLFLVVTTTKQYGPIYNGPVMN